MNEQEFKKCLKIHGYMSSEEESDIDSKDHLDEIYEKFKPPPIQIDCKKHNIIEIGAKNHSNEGLSKSQRKRKRKKKTNESSVVVKNVSANTTSATDKITCDTFVHVAAINTSCSTTKTLKQGNKTTNGAKKIKNTKIKPEDKTPKNGLITTGTKNSKNNETDTSTNPEVDILEQVEHTYADVLKRSKVYKVKIPAAKLLNHVGQRYNTVGLTKKEKNTLRKKVWKTYGKTVNFDDTSEYQSEFCYQENHRPLTFGDFFDVRCVF